uniref:L-lactate dehydrogenase (cytochrome) n=1 Tax=Arcella intermedia TaxID=1963864 RepID=A0A6B2L320_9EUKA
MREVAKHNRREDCWIVVGGGVYDITAFLKEHPGGEKILMECAGKDASVEYAKIHAPAILNMLPRECCVGRVDQGTVKEEDKAVLARAKREFVLPHISQILNVYDMEYVASQVMDKEGWDYYVSGGDDEITLRENHAAFQRIWLKPRVLVDVSTIDSSSSILGFKTSFPIYISATALGKLAHPEGEVAISRGAYNQGIPYMLPTLASCSFDEMLGAKAKDQTLFYQLYVNPDRKATEAIIRKAEAGGCKVLCVTVDAPQLGKRERDMRNKFSASTPDLQKGKVERNQGAAKALSKFIDPSLNWSDIEWLRSITKMPIVLKGIQCAEDAVLAAKYGVKGIILSNHGGRQIDFSRSAIEILPEVISALKSVGVPTSGPNGMEVWIDGGVRRGSDIYKAIALGATAVGIGRAALYGLAGYGSDGVEKVIEILREEFERTMAGMGNTSVKAIHPDSLIYKNLSDHTNGVPNDFLQKQTYTTLRPISKL